MTKRIYALTAALVLLASTALGQGVIGGGILGVSGGNYPLRLQPSAWYDAGQGYCYQDSAIQFVSADKSMLTGTRPTLTGTWMWCAWVKKSATAATQNIVSVNTSASVGNSSFALRITAGNVISMVGYSGVSTVVSAANGSGATAGTWYFVTGGYNATTQKIFLSVDGAALIESDLASVNAGAVALTVGGSADNSLYLDGSIDSLMFFCPASTEISNIITWAYNAGAGRLCSEITTAQKTAWGATNGWELGEPAGVRYDSWGSNHLSQSFAELVTNGTFTGASTGWTEGAGWAYGTNNEAATAADANLTQTTVVPTVGKLYSTSFALTATTGSLRFQLGGVDGTTRTTTATHTETFRAVSTATLAFDPVATFTGVLDTVSIKAAEILPAPGIVRGASQDSNFATQLNGTSQYFSIADANANAFDPGEGSWSVGASFYLDKAPNNFYLANCQEAASPYEGWGIVIGPATVNAYCSNGTADRVQTTSASGAISAGNWYTIIVVYDRSGNCTIYINGTASGSPQSLASVTGSIAPTQTLWIGTGSGVSYFWPGRLDNVFYVSRALTAPEIAYVHNNGEWRQWSELGVSGTDGVNLTSSVVKGFYEFDAKASLGLDSTGAGNQLTPAGTPTQGMGVNYLEGQVSYWVDRSGNGKHASITTLANYPAYCTAVINGKPVVRFDGVDDYLTTALAGLPSATIYFVGKMNAADDIAIGVMETHNRSGVGSSGADKFAGMVGTQTTTNITSNDDPGTANFYGTLVYDGSTVQLYFNGNQEYSDAQAATVVTALTYAIGARRTGAAAIDNYLDGDIAAILIYPRALTATELGRMNGWIQRTYGITP